MNIEEWLRKNKGNKLKYKRSLNAPMRYAGGKSLATGIILSHFPKDIDKIVSVFIGGGSIEFTCGLELGMKVVSADVFDLLINFYNELKYNKDKLIKMLRSYDTSKETFEKIRLELVDDYKGVKKIKNKTELASKYFYNHNLSYAPSYLGWASSNYIDKPLKYARMIDKLEKMDLKNMEFINESFETFIPKYNKEFMYLDPPYYLGGSSKMFTGIYPMRNNPFHHKNFDHQKLFELLKEHKGGFVLSYNDCEEIRDLYKNYKIIEVEWQYTMGQGETRIGKNRKEKGLTNIKQSHEILIIGEKVLTNN